MKKVCGTFQIAAAASDDFLHKATVIIRPAITNDNEIIFFILIVFNYE